MDRLLSPPDNPWSTGLLRAPPGVRKLCPQWTVPVEHHASRKMTAANSLWIVMPNQPGFRSLADAMSEEQTFPSKVNGSVPLRDIDHRRLRMKSKTYNGEVRLAKRTLNLCSWMSLLPRFAPRSRTHRFNCRIPDQ